MNSLFIIEFIDNISQKLKHFASQTKGEYSYEDLRHEAYFYCLEFNLVHHRYPSPLDNQDKTWVLGRIFNEYVKWADHTFRNSIRIGPSETDDNETWSFDLPAAENSDPIVQLLFRERSNHLNELLEYSYSEAKAYVVSFSKFNSDKVLLSSFLFITTDTLGNRCARAMRMVSQQPSLFDSIEKIDDSFSPTPGREKLKVSCFVAKQQLPLYFE